MTDLKKRYSKIFKEKFQGSTVTSNIVDTSANTTTGNNVNYLNRNVKKV
jgi:hypothetical protein